MMREILSKEELEKKESRNRTIITIIIIVILAFSTAGYSLMQRQGSSSSTTEKYKGYQFSLADDGLWHFIVNNQEYATQFTPKSTENISFSLKSISYANKPLYFSYDSDSRAVSELVRNLKGAQRSQFVCTDNCTEDLPIKDCTNNVITIKIENTTLIKQENNCVYISANSEDIIRASDAFIFKILGI